MVAPTQSPDVPDTPVWRRIHALSTDMRTLYRETYEPALEQASAASGGLELPDGTRLDPTYSADAIACRAINNVLAGLIEWHLPGATLRERVDDAPTVIDSTWHYGHDDGHDLEVTICWDYRHDFGDSDGLSVTARKVVAR